VCYNCYVSLKKADFFLIRTRSGDKIYARHTAVGKAAHSVTNSLRKGSSPESASPRMISRQKEVMSLYEGEPLRPLSRESSAASLKEKTSETTPLQFVIQQTPEDSTEDFMDAATSVLEQKTAEEVFTEVMTFKKRGVKIPASLQREASMIMGFDLPKYLSYDDDSASTASPAPTRPKQSASRVSSRAPSPGPSSAVREVSLGPTSAPPVLASWNASLPPRSNAVYADGHHSTCEGKLKCF
jgi:hypothetical protein